MTSNGREKRQLLYEVVADSLIQKIQQGMYTVGNYIPTERELAESYSASRGVIREAIRILEQKGYIENVPGGKRKLLRSNSEEEERDAIYAQLEKAKIEEFLDARTYLDDIIVTLACQRATEEDLRQIEKVYLQIHAYYCGEGDTHDPSVLQQFHLVIAEAAHNSVLENVYRMAITLMEPLRRKSLQTKSNRMKMLEEHTDIFHAISDRNIPFARLAIQKHNRNVKERYEKDRKDG